MQMMEMVMADIMAMVMTVTTMVKVSTAIRQLCFQILY